MPENSTIVEVIKFRADGLTQLAAETKAMGRAVDDATAKQKAMAGLLANPVYSKYAAGLERANRAFEVMSARARNVSYAHGLADGSVVRHLSSLQKLNAEYAKMRREAEAAAKYGTGWGGRFMAKYGERLNKVGTMAGVGLAGAGAAGLGLARQGFSGTVEQARFDAEQVQLAREFASVMKPALEFMTRAARTLRRYMQGLDGTGQNVFMAGLLGGGTAGGALALRGAARMFGYATATTAAATATGNVAGNIAGNVAGGAAGGAAARSAAGRATGGAAARGAAARGGMLGSVGRALPVIGGFIQAGTAAYEDYERYSTTGFTFRNVLNTGLRSLDNIPGASWARKGLDETLGKMGFEGGTKSGRRDVQLSGGGFETMDQSYERLTSAIEKQESNEFEQLTTATRDLTEEIRRVRGAPPIERPGAR